MPFITPWYAITLSVAMRFHAGQVDKCGKPYWAHLDRVARNLVRLWPDAPKEQVQAALLHDVLEDTNATPDSLRALGVTDEVIDIVRRLSRYDTKYAIEGQDYLEWIQSIADSGNVSAIRVKIADNMDNSDPARSHPCQAAMIATKYAPAWDAFMRGLAASEAAA